MKFASLFVSHLQRLTGSSPSDRKSTKTSVTIIKVLLSHVDLMDGKWLFCLSKIQWWYIEKSNMIRTFSAGRHRVWVSKSGLARSAAQPPRPHSPPPPPRTPPLLRGNLIYKWWNTNAVPHVRTPPPSTHTHHLGCCKLLIDSSVG